MLKMSFNKSLILLHVGILLIFFSPTEQQALSIEVSNRQETLQADVGDGCSCASALISIDNLGACLGPSENTVGVFP